MGEETRAQKLQGVDESCKMLSSGCVESVKSTITEAQVPSIGPYKTGPASDHLQTGRRSSMALSSIPTLLNYWYINILEKEDHCLELCTRW